MSLDMFAAAAAFFFFRIPRKVCFVPCQFFSLTLYTSYYKTFHYIFL